MRRNPPLIRSNIAGNQDFDPQRQAALLGLVAQAQANPNQVTDYPTTALGNFGQGITNSLAPIAQQILFKKQMEDEKVRREQEKEDRDRSMHQQKLSNLHSLMETLRQNGNEDAVAELMEQKEVKDILGKELNLSPGSISHPSALFYKSIGAMSGGKIDKQKAAEWISSRLPKSTESVSSGFKIDDSSDVTMPVKTFQNRNKPPHQLQREMIDFEGSADGQRISDYYRSQGSRVNPYTEKLKAIQGMLVGQTRATAEYRKAILQASTREEAQAMADALEEEYGITVAALPSFKKMRDVLNITNEERGVLKEYTDAYLDQEFNAHLPENQKMVHDAQRTLSEKRKGLETTDISLTREIGRINNDLSRMSKEVVSEELKAINNFARNSTKENASRAALAARSIRDKISAVTASVSASNVLGVDAGADVLESLVREINNVSGNSFGIDNSALSGDFQRAAEHASKIIRSMDSVRANVTKYRDFLIDKQKSISSARPGGKAYVAPATVDEGTEISAIPKKMDAFAYQKRLEPDVSKYNKKPEDLFKALSDDEVKEYYGIKTSTFLDKNVTVGKETLPAKSIFLTINDLSSETGDSDGVAIYYKPDGQPVFNFLSKIETALVKAATSKEQKPSFRDVSTAFKPPINGNLGKLPNKFRGKGIHQGNKRHQASLDARKVSDDEKAAAKLKKDQDDRVDKDRVQWKKDIIVERNILAQSHGVKSDPKRLQQLHQEATEKVAKRELIKRGWSKITSANIDNFINDNGLGGSFTAKPAVGKIPKKKSIADQVRDAAKGG